MPVTVAFRGVGAFVRDSKTGAISHLLFPNAESVSPPNAEMGDEGLPRHADNTRATPHYAGMLIPSSSGDEYIKLLNRVVRFLGTALPTLSGPVTLTSIADMTDGQDAKKNPYALTLLPRTQWHSVDGQVATDIELHDGTLSAGPLSGTPFNVDGHHRKDKTPILPKQYSPSVTWTAKDENDVQVEIHKVLDKQGTLVLERTVTLRPASSFSAHIYNFDNGLPTVDELKKETTVECKGRLSDHDFKWIYALMNRHPGFPKWQDWLDGEEFPTPWASCRQLKSIKLLPVSTCFQTVVDE